MGNLKAEYLEQTYIDLAPLKDAEDCRTYLTRSQVDGSLAVRKEICALQYPLYQQLIDFSHPSLARVLETYTKDGRYFVLEEYVSGSTIGSYLKRGYHFQEHEILSFISQLCSALSFLHAHNIIHRDVTPENLLISTDNVLKLIDFGISRSKKEDQSQDTTILGTVGYAAPEQFGFGQTDERTDIYATGVLLNVLLTGSLPKDDLPFDPRYRQIVLKCTSISPADRYSSVSELKSQIMAIKPTRIYQAEIEEPSAKAPCKDSLIRRFFRHVPGFRTGNPGKMIVAIIGYFLMILFVVVNGTRPLEPGDIRSEYWTINYFFVGVWAAYVNLGNYCGHIEAYDKVGPLTRLLLRTAVALAVFLTTGLLLYFENYCLK